MAHLRIVDGNHMTQRTSGISFYHERREFLARSTRNH